MRAQLRILLAFLLVALPVSLATAGDDADATVTGYAALGGRSADVDDSPDLAAEYRDTDDNPVLGFTVASHQTGGSFELKAKALSDDDLAAALDFDISRAVRSHTSFSSLLHRLGHDPMENLEATSINGKVVWHEDLAPGQDYDLTYQEMRSRTEIQLPNLNALTLAFTYREQQRDGHRQAYIVNHCDTCHIVSKPHELDERTADGTLEAKVAWKGGHIVGQVTSREHRQGVSNLVHTYDDALHPEKQIPIFDNRLQYDSAEGPLPVDLWPDIDKDIGRINLHLNNLAGFVVNGGGVWAETTNRYTNLSSDYTGYVVNAARVFGKSTRLRWRGRVYSIDNDSVFVDTNERVTLAGPQAGLTYEDVYGQNFDFTRTSAMNRDVIDSGLDLSYRIGRKAGTVRFLWDYESVDRDHYEVAVGTTETTTNVLGVTWNTRPAKGWKVWADLRHGDVDNPYMLVDGACSTLVSDRYPDPFNPETPQYNEFQDARIADTTASPSSWDQARIRGSYTSGATTVSATYSWWDGSNSSGDLTDWSRTNQSATVTLWSAPAERWEWYAAYAWQDSELDAPVCLPVFDG
jgi:hypothetical protein